MHGVQPCSRQCLRLIHVGVDQETALAKVGTGIDFVCPQHLQTALPVENKPAQICGNSCMIKKRGWSGSSVKLGVRSPRNVPAARAISALLNCMGMEEPALGNGIQGSLAHMHTHHTRCPQGFGKHAERYH